MIELNTIALAPEGIQVRITYDAVKVAFLRMTAREHKAKDPFDPETKVWTLPLKAAADLRHLNGVRHAPDFAALLEREMASRGDHDACDAAIFRDWDVTAPLPNGKTLYEHQREGVKWLLQVKRGILGDEMGVGKTIQSLVASKRIYEVAKLPTIILTKAKLVTDWQAEAKSIGHPYFSVHSWGKPPKPVEGRKFVLIADEAHMAQNPRAQRTKAFLALAEEASFTWLLSGTPMKNGRPENLYTLLRAIKHPIASKKSEFDTRYCGARLRPMKVKGRTIQIWDTTGATNRDELKQALAPVLLMRKKKDCLDLPDKTIVRLDVDVTPEMQAEHDRLFAEARARYKARVERGDVSDEGEALAIATMLRQAAARAKIAAAIEQTEQAVEEGAQVIVFSEFIAPVHAIAAHFNVRPYVGGIGNTEADTIKEGFQAGRSRVFAGTRSAGGTGLNLTAASVVVFVDRPMTPGDADQAIDRAHRLGTKWPVTGYWLRAFPVCYALDDLLDEKQKNIDAMFAGTTGSGKVSNRELLQRIYQKNG